MKYNYTKYKLNEVGEIIAGGTPKTTISEYWNGDIPWITPKDLSNYKQRYISKGERSITKTGLCNSNAKLMPRNSILFTSRAPIGYIAIANNDISTNQGFKSIVCNKEICNHLYMYYWLKNNIEMIKSKSNGSTFQEVSGSVMKSIDIDLPELWLQEKVVNILNSIDDKIETNNQINKNLQSISQLLFKHWFVDFEFPNEAGKPYRSSGGEMVESELGMIPKGWEVKHLSDLIDIRYGKDHKKLLDGNMPVYGSGGIMRYVASKLFEGESVLIPRKGTLNNVVYVDEAFWTVDTMFYSVMKSEYIAKFVYHFVKSKDLASMNVGSAVPSMTTNVLNSLPIIVSDEELLRNFDNTLTPIYQKIISNKKENQSLINTRDTLLPKLMNGEIDVSNIEINE